MGDIRGLTWANCPIICLDAGEDLTCLGRKTPHTCLLHADSPAPNESVIKLKQMEEKVQTIKSRVVGLDAHSEKLVLCIMEKHSSGNAALAKVLRTITCTVTKLEETFKKHTSKADEIILEASTNSFSIVSRLRLINRNAFVIKSESVSGIARKDRITDEIDAENIARLWLSGFAKIVWVPDENIRTLRDIFFGYRNTTKDRTRTSNRIWAFCSGHGFKLPVRSRKKKVADVKEQVLSLKWTQTEKFHIEHLILCYERACEDRDSYLSQINKIVSSDPDMIKMMQILGIRTITAFSLKAFIGDISRFPSPKKLVSYIGLNPRVCGSGKYEATRSLSVFGRRDLKAILIECAQSALRTGKDSVHRWARKLSVLKGEKKAVVALARKMLTYLWHVLMGHPCPSVSAPQGYEAKLVKLSSSIGNKYIKSLGFEKSSEWIIHVLKSQNFIIQKT